MGPDGCSGIGGLLSGVGLWSCWDRVLEALAGVPSAMVAMMETVGSGFYSPFNVLSLCYTKAECVYVQRHLGTVESLL